MNTEIVKVEFDGDVLECIKDGEQIGVVVRPICEHLGLDPDGQQQKLARRSWASTCKMQVQVPGDGQRRSFFCVDLDTLLMWLATLNENMVRADVRPKLVRYQQKCKQAIAAVFRGALRPDPRDARIAQLEAQLRQLRPGTALRPTDIAAAWCKAHLEPSKEPMLLMDIWPRYVEWSQANGRPMPSAPTVLSGGLAPHFHRARGAGLNSRASFYCALRAEPLPVDLPVQVQAQQELPLPAAQAGEAPGPALALRALAVLLRHPAGLEAAHMAQVLGAPVPQMTAVLGGMVEAGDLHVAARAGRLLYQPAPQPEPMTDLQQQVKGFMEARPGHLRVATREVLEGLGLEPTRANEMRVGMALRSLGYERIRHNNGSGWRRYSYVKPEDKN